MLPAAANSPNSIAVIDHESGLTAEELADMQGDMVHVKSKLPRWRFNGSAGFLFNQQALKADRKGILDRAGNPHEPNRTSEYARTIRGVILALTYSQGLNRTDEEEKQKVYSESWLCYSANKSHAPRINPELPEHEQKMVLARGAGVNCLKCPLARYREDLGKAECSAGIRLLFRAIADENEPAQTWCFTFSGYSVKALNDFLDITFFQRNRPTIGSLIEVGRRSESKDRDGKTMDFFVATFREIEQIPKNRWRELYELRKLNINNFERPEDVADEMERDSAPIQPEERMQAPPSAGLELDEDGNPVYGKPAAAAPPEDAWEAPF